MLASDHDYLLPGLLASALIVLVRFLQSDQDLGCGLEQCLGFRLLYLPDIVSDLLNELIEHLAGIRDNFTGPVGETCRASVHNVTLLSISPTVQHGHIKLAA